MSTALIILFLGVIYFLAHAFNGIFKVAKIPDVIWLIFIGLLVGPVLGMVSPSDLGEVGPVFITITLVVILFEGGLDIGLKTLRDAWSRGVALTVVNFVATTLVIGITAILLTDLTPLSAFMLGAILGAATPSIVMPILNHLKMSTNSKTVLILEAALSEVLSIVITLALLDALTNASDPIGFTIGKIISSFFLAILWGIFGAFLWSFLLHKIRNLKNSILATLAFVFIIFSISELLGFSGYIAALVFGISLGNIETFRLVVKNIRPFNFTFEPVTLNETERQFFSETVFVLKSFVFVFIGISIQFTDSWCLLIGLILTIIIFIIRIPVIRFSVSNKTTKEDASLMAAIVPKGLAAAALASLPLKLGIAGGELIQNVIFSVVLFSIIFTAILVFLVQKTALSGFYSSMFPGFGKLNNVQIDSTGDDSMYTEVDRIE